MSEKNDEILTDARIEQAKQAVFKNIFKQSRFGMRDGLNEYDEDYTTFSDLGDLIPAEMQLALARLETKTDTENSVLSAAETNTSSTQQS